MLRWQSGYLDCIFKVAMKHQSKTHTCCKYSSTLVASIGKTSSKLVWKVKREIYREKVFPHLPHLMYSLCFMQKTMICFRCSLQLMPFHTNVTNQIMKLYLKFWNTLLSLTQKWTFWTLNILSAEYTTNWNLTFSSKDFKSLVSWSALIPSRASNLQGCQRFINTNGYVQTQHYTFYMLRWNVKKLSFTTSILNWYTSSGKLITVCIDMDLEE